MHPDDPRTIAFIGSYVPRCCGIATFTRDLQAAVAACLPETRCFVVPVTDPERTYAYPPEVRFACTEGDPGSFRRAAAFLNLANVDVVALQHEYGLFGGEAGGHVLALLRELRVPLHTTLHTLLASPSAAERRVLDEIIQLSARLAVMSERGRQLLTEVHGVAADRIDVIPHGIPDMPFVDPAFHKDRFGLDGRDVLLTFGLLAANKGIETMIAALPRLAAAHPGVVYVVLGATHPQVARREGERYRRDLERLATELGVADRVVFHDRYVEPAELLEFLGAADIYVTPYHNEAQITSGTLAYAFGCGKAVVSTPYWHAQELLADGRGRLVPFRNPAALADTIADLLADPAQRTAMRKRGWQLGRDMVWSRVAGRYVDAFRLARRARTVRLRRPAPTGPTRPPHGPLPPVMLEHLWRLSDSTGVFQHATFDVPNLMEGYCTDDNARALALMVRLEDLGLQSRDTLAAAAIHTAFVGHAFDPGTGRFRNFLGFDRRWLDTPGDSSDDCLGRAVVALGTCIGRSRSPSLQRWAMRLFEPAVRAVAATTSPRAWAFGLVGIEEYLGRLAGDRLAADIRATLLGRLLDLRRATAGPDWPWLEDIVSYENPRICQALLEAGVGAGDESAVAAGLEMLDWLATIQHSDTGRFAPIGCQGFFPRGGVPAPFDQQPIEAQAMVAACAAAFRATQDPAWVERAWAAFDWFRGRNVLGVGLCNPRTGGCRDGLLADRANENQGAESTLAYLAAIVDMRVLEARAGTMPPAGSHSRNGSGTGSGRSSASGCLQLPRHSDAASGSA
jgi:glycosyltransferase involved in cell wall biosynthesis